MSIFTSYQEKVKRLFSFNKIQDIIPVLAYDDDDEYFICEGPYIACTLICQPTNGVNDKVRTSFQMILKDDWPADCFVQTTLISLPYINKFVDGYKRLRGKRMKGTDGEYADFLSQSNIDYLTKSTDTSLNESLGIKPKDFEFWFTIKIPIKKQMPTKSEIVLLNELKLKVKESLDNIGMSPYTMNDDDYLLRMQIIMNPGNNSLWKQNRNRVNYGQPLGQQVLEQGRMVKFHENKIEFGAPDKADQGFASMMSIRALPETMVYGQMMDLITDWRNGFKGVWNNFAITLNIHIPDQEKAQAAFSKDKAWLANQARGKMLESVERLKFQLQDYSAVNHEIEEENANIVSNYLQITMFGSSEENLKEGEDQLSAFAKDQGFLLTKDIYLAGPLFLSSLPMGVDISSVKFFERYSRMTTTGTAFLIPHVASWKGNTNKPVMNFVTRNGQIFGMDLFHTNSSFNALICAKSGAGKSFLTCSIIDAYLGSGIADFGLDEAKQLDPGVNGIDDGAQVFVIDVGRSYENMCDNYVDAQFLAFGDDLKYSLDPFASIDDFYGKEGQMNMVLSLLKSMASESGELTDTQSAQMMILLCQLWDEKGQDSSITEFATICKNHGSEDVKRIGIQLTPFTDGMPYGDFFSKKYEPVNFSGRLIVCELEELGTMPHLQQCVLMALINAAQHNMFLTGTDRRKIFILDEAWQFLKDKPGKVNYLAEFLENGWRRFRKSNSTGICVTQSLMDAYKTDAGKAIVVNSPWKLLMMQEPETIEVLKSTKAYDASDGEFQLMKSVHTSKGVYSEIYVRCEGQQEIVKLFVDRKRQLTYSTDPKDRTAIKRYLNLGQSRAEAVDSVYKDERRAKGMTSEDMTLEESIEASR
jgi:conjugal transfer ATP-binding protein TraC